MVGLMNMFKATETFVISHSEEIKPASIKDAGALINYVIGINNDLLDRGKSGWLIAKKVSTKKKVDTVIYATRLDLPLLEDNPYFTKLLEPFYQSKPVAFDESILLAMDESQSLATESAPKEVSSPALPENLQSLVAKGTDALQQEEQPISEIKHVSEEPVSTPEKISLISEEQAKEYEQEIERLKRELEQKNDILALKVKQETERQAQQNLVQPVLPVKMPEIANSNDLPEVVGTVLQYQLTQLEQDIKQKDTRGQLKESIINDFKDRKKKAIENKLIELEAEKNLKLEKPKAEYERLVKEIEDEHQEIKNKEMISITTYYEKECQLKIDSETDKQSLELAEYLRTRKSELLSWQQSFNADIESQVGSLFYVFKLSEN